MKKVTTIVLTLTALMAGAGGARSSDIQSTYDWSGLYLGLGAGYSHSSSDAFDPFCAVNPGICNTQESSGKGNNFVGSVFVGANHQFDGGLVLGVETDIGLGSDTRGPVEFGGIEDNDARYGVDLGLQGTARVRAGFAIDRLMPFVTGGIAFATYDGKYTEPDFPAGAPRSGSGNFVGWTLGGGLNYAMTDNVFLGAEYRYINYGKDSTLLSSSVDTNLWSVENKLRSHEIKATLGFKF